jgi:hypothetical protein
MFMVFGGGLELKDISESERLRFNTIVTAWMDILWSSSCRRVPGGRYVMEINWIKNGLGKKVYAS